MHLRVEQFKTFGHPVPLASIQALAMYIYELAFSGDPQGIVRSMRYRICLASACRDMLQEEIEEAGLNAEESWMSWIKRESRRRTLINIYYTEMSVSLHLGFPSLLKLSDLRMPLPCSNEV